MADWSEELFCDLFAIQLVGPCYSYAFIEIFDLSNHLNSEGSLDLEATSLPLQFSSSHPSYLYRVRKQAERLKILKWWEHVYKSKSASQNLLEQSEKLSLDRFSFSPFEQELQHCFVEALEKIIADITEAVEGSLPGLDTGVEEYARLNERVKDYFLEGVIPSTIQDPASHKAEFPDAVTVLNAAYQLYLDNLPELIAKIKGQRSAERK